MQRILFFCTPLLFFVPFVSGAFDPYRSGIPLELAIQQQEKETTEKKILCEPFDESQYPPKFLERVKKIDEDVQKRGGVALIGRIRYTDGSEVKPNDLTFSLHEGFFLENASNCYAFDGGWFTSYNIKPGLFHKEDFDNAEAEGRSLFSSLSVLSMDCFPTTAVFRLKRDQLMYLDFELEKVPPEKQLTIFGCVCDEAGTPFSDTVVVLSLSQSTGSGGDEPRKKTKTDTNGRFTFDSLAPHQYSVHVFKEGYEGGVGCDPPKEETDRVITLPNLVMYKPKKIVFDFVYQPDGSRDFATGDLKVQTLEMKPHSGGVMFKECKVDRNPSGRDLDLFIDKQRNLFWCNVFVTSGNGVYDAGEVPFDSIHEAKNGDKHYRPEGTPSPIPVEKNHVYVVRTYSGHYAKLIVRDIVTIEP
jgi:hypothetical protein